VTMVVQFRMGLASRNVAVRIDRTDNSSFFGATQLANGTYPAITQLRFNYNLLIANWNNSMANQARLKRVNSIAQVLRYTTNAGEQNPTAPYPNGPSNGLFRSGCRVIGGAWGAIGDGFEIDGENWDDSQTLNQGSYPGAPYVTWNTHNQWFVESSISVWTGTP
jgi:hypothetical protein